MTNANIRTVARGTKRSEKMSGELFVRRALAQKSMTKSERFMGATRWEDGRDAR